MQGTESRGGRLVGVVREAATSDERPLHAVTLSFVKLNHVRAWYCIPYKSFPINYVP